MDRRPSPPREFATPERCFITELVNRASLPSVSIARARVEPGVTTALHTVGVEEWYVIESGEGLMHLGAAPPCPVGPGDHVRIPAGQPQRIANTGSRDLLFFCVCTPRFTPDEYLALE